MYSRNQDRKNAAIYKVLLWGFQLHPPASFRKPSPRRHPTHQVPPHDNGNNDFFSNLEREIEFEIDGYKILLTHGHYYGVSMGPEYIMEEGISRGVDIVMYGHTHRPELIRTEEITVLNPGSISYPRQEGRKPTYILMEIDKKNNLNFFINYC